MRLGSRLARLQRARLVERVDDFGGRRWQRTAAGSAVLGKAHTSLAEDQDDEDEPTVGRTTSLAEQLDLVVIEAFLAAGDDLRAQDPRLSPYLMLMSKDGPPVAGFEYDPKLGKSVPCERQVVQRGIHVPRLQEGETASEAAVRLLPSFRDAIDMVTAGWGRGIHSLRDHVDLHFMATVSRRQLRRRYGDVLAGKLLVVDLDDGARHDEGEWPEGVPLPTAQWETSPGRRVAIWRLEGTWTLTDIEEAQRRVCRVLGGDRAGTGRTHTFRFWDSRNSKRGCWTKVLHVDPDRRYAKVAFEALPATVFDPETRTRSEPHEVKGTSTRDPERAAPVGSRTREMPTSIRDLLRHGGPDPSSALMTIVVWAVGNGYDLDRLRRRLLQSRNLGGKSLQRREHRPEALDRYWQHTVNKARKYVAEHHDPTRVRRPRVETEIQDRLLACAEVVVEHWRGGGSLSDKEARTLLGHLRRAHACRTLNYVDGYIEVRYSAPTSQIAQEGGISTRTVNRAHPGLYEKRLVCQEVRGFTGTSSSWHVSVPAPSVTMKLLPPFTPVILLSATGLVATGDAHPLLAA